jgi:hypothetical protein
MAIYQVTDADGNTNRIIADQEFVDQHYPGAVLLNEPVIEIPEPQNVTITLTDQQIAVLKAAGLL